MTRDVRGRVVGKIEPDKDEAVRGQKAEEREARDAPKDPGAIHKTIESHDKMLAEHDSQISAHHDRLTNLEKAMGVAKKADNMRDQDQAGSKGRTQAGESREKADAMYSRRRS